MGLEFLFIHALWALPLAGLPILLHLLFRRKSPVVPFSTLRFIRSSLQHTAARRRVQRWLLLATRALLLLLLIWALAQPARRLATAWLTGPATAAAIVVDTSYSMLLQDQQVSLLDRAGHTVEDLLRGQLHGAQVAVFQSRPTGDEQLRPAAAWLAQWTPPQPQPAIEALLHRINAAIQLLRDQEADQKWLIVLTDLHAREFPQPLGDLDNLRVALIDLRPPDSRAAGITRLSIDPPRPIPGITSEVLVDVAGRSGDSRALALTLRTPDGQVLQQYPPQLLRFDATGRAQLRMPVELPPQRWLQIVATLQTDDATPHDNTRTLLVEVPPRQRVTVLEPPTATPAARFAQLALDPSESRQPAWPLQVARAPRLSGDEDVAVALLTRWPDQAEARRLLDLARGGGTVILFLQPGLESTWAQLDEPARRVLGQLLPGEPSPTPPSGDMTPTAMDDPALQGVAATPEQLAGLTVQRIVPLQLSDPSATPLLRLTVGSGRSTYPLLARRRVAGGRVFTWTTLPETRFTNLPLHPLFLQAMVTTALPALDQAGAANVEIGHPLRLPARHAGARTELDLEAPDGQVTRITLRDTPDGRFFAYDRTDLPGRYTWRPHNATEPLALGNVQLPAAEADIRYREPSDILPPAENVVVARSLDELQDRLTEISEPAPRWTWAIALVLILMCLEALMASVTRLWQPRPLRSFLPGLTGAPALR